MDFLIKFFARCMALTVVITPFCVFASIEVPQLERPLADIKFDFTKPAADFKAEVNKKVEQAQDIQKRKAISKKRFGGVLRGVLKCMGLVLGSVIAGVVTCFALLIVSIIPFLRIIGGILLFTPYGGVIGYSIFVAWLAAGVIYFGPSIYRDFKGEPEVFAKPVFKNKN